MTAAPPDRREAFHGDHSSRVRIEDRALRMAAAGAGAEGSHQLVEAMEVLLLQLSP